MHGKKKDTLEQDKTKHPAKKKKKTVLLKEISNQTPSPLLVNIVSPTPNKFTPEKAKN